MTVRTEAGDRARPIGRRFYFRLLACLVGAWVAACNEETPDTAAAPDSWIVDTLLLSIGDIDGPIASTFGRVIDADILPDVVVVLDMAANEVRLFDRAGHSVRSFGREGDGPGEFQRASALWIAHPDTIVVFDEAEARVSRFTIDGLLISTSTLSGYPSRRPVLPVGVLSSGDLVVGWSEFSPSTPLMPSGTPLIAAFGRFDRDGTFIETVGRGNGLWITAEGNHPMSPSPMAVLWQDTIYYTDGVRVIHRFLDGGESLDPIPLVPTHRDTPRAWTILEGAVDRSGDPRKAEAFSVAAEPAQVPTVARLLIDRQGLLWMKRFDPATDPYILNLGFSWAGGEWIVTDRSGRTIASLSMPAGFSPMAVGDSMIVGLRRDELGVEHVQVYALTRTSIGATPPSSR